MYWIQVAVVVSLLLIFQLGLQFRILAVMHGSRLVEHAHLVVVGLIPLPPGWLPDWWWWTLTILLVLTWLFALIAWIDDTRQHWIRAHRDPGYRSRLHEWGWFSVGVPVRDWLADHLWEDIRKVG
jgi:hypothetical protein